MVNKYVKKIVKGYMKIPKYNVYPPMIIEDLPEFFDQLKLMGYEIEDYKGNNNVNKPSKPSESETFKPTFTETDVDLNKPIFTAPSLNEDNKETLSKDNKPTEELFDKLSEEKKEESKDEEEKVDLTAEILKKNPLKPTKKKK